jgi:hypothetical protein
VLLNINAEKTLPAELCLLAEFFIKICTKSSHLSYFLMIFYVLQEDQLQLMATSLLSVFKYFQNEATSNQAGPESEQLQPMVWLHLVGLQSSFRSSQLDLPVQNGITSRYNSKNTSGATFSDPLSTESWKMKIVCIHLHTFNPPFLITLCILSYYTS